MYIMLYDKGSIKKMYHSKENTRDKSKTRKNE